MDESTKKELHDTAWNLLKEKGLSLGQMMTVRANFASQFKDEYPFIYTHYVKGEIRSYHSEIKDIQSYSFNSEKEVILANAIYETIKDKFDPNEFIQMLKFTFRILGVKSAWC